MQEITRANWRSTPALRWSFTHVDALLPTTPVACASDNAAPLPVCSLSPEGFRIDLPRGKALDLPGFLAAVDADALVVLHGGALVHQWNADAEVPERPHIAMSMTKAVTGLLAAILIGRGTLDPAMRVSDLVPEVAESGFAGATIRHLLDMRAGVVPGPADEEAYAAALAGTGPGFHDYLAALPVAEPHGGAFRYVSANYDLLGWAMERATGKPFATLLTDLLWQPLGAEAPASIITDDAGAAWATGGLSAHPRDVARLGQLVLASGERDGTAILPPGTVEDLARGGDVDAWRTGEWGRSFAFLGPEVAYRNGWYSLGGPTPYLFAMGVHGQTLLVDRAAGLVVVLLASQKQRTDGRAIGLVHHALPAFRRWLAG